MVQTELLSKAYFIRLYFSGQQICDWLLEICYHLVANVCEVLLPFAIHIREKTVQIQYSVINDKEHLIANLQGIKELMFNFLLSTIVGAFHENVKIGVIFKTLKYTQVTWLHIYTNVLRY